GWVDEGTAPFRDAAFVNEGTVGIDSSMPDGQEDAESEADDEFVGELPQGLVDSLDLPSLSNGTGDVDIFSSELV
ncbi:MAG: hypothetical protein RR619_11440, partial [Raoultibacter sp.]